MFLNPLTLREDGSLSCELLQHFSSTGESVTTLTDADVQTELADAELSHGVLLLLTLVLKKKIKKRKNQLHVLMVQKQQRSTT